MCATHTALHGHIAEAFRLNPVGMVLLRAALLGICLEFNRWVLGEPPPDCFHLGRFEAGVILIIILVFWILRNIPEWPCTLLAPPQPCLENGVLPMMRVNRRIPHAATARS